jgi:hypothetical protein
VDLLTEPTPRRTVIQRARTLFETNFERVADEPEAWRLEAASLLRAAEALRLLMDRDAAAYEQGAVGDPVDHPVGHVYMLIAGLAIENLVKARVVSINGGSGSKPGRLSAEVKTHDLLQLFDMAGLALSDDEAYSPSDLRLSSSGLVATLWERSRMTTSLDRLQAEEARHWMCGSRRTWMRSRH